MGRRNRVFLSPLAKPARPPYPCDSLHKCPQLAASSLRFAHFSFSVPSRAPEHVLRARALSTCSEHMLGARAPSTCSERFGAPLCAPLCCALGHKGERWKKPCARTAKWTPLKAPAASPQPNQRQPTPAHASPANAGKRGETRGNAGKRGETRGNAGKRGETRQNPESSSKIAKETAANRAQVENGSPKTPACVPLVSWILIRDVFAGRSSLLCREQGVFMVVLPHYHHFCMPAFGRSARVGWPVFCV
jgi:hypothetical protein